MTGKTGHSGIAEAGMKKRKRRETSFLIAMTAIWTSLACFLLIYGDRIYSPATVVKVLSGESVKSASYAIWSIRLPRVLVGTFAGFAFGTAGNTFQ